MRDFASHLKAQPKSADAAFTMISDLLRFGEALPATPATLDILRDDLSRLATKATPSTNRPERSIPYVRTALFIILPAVMLSALLAYGYFNPAFQPFQIFARQEVPKEEPEISPLPARGSASSGNSFATVIFRKSGFARSSSTFVVPRTSRPIICWRMTTIHAARISTFWTKTCGL